jgi:hypothetical protein
MNKWVLFKSSIINKQSLYASAGAPALASPLSTKLSIIFRIFDSALVLLLYCEAGHLQILQLWQVLQ